MLNIEEAGSGVIVQFGSDSITCSPTATSFVIRRPRRSKSISPTAACSIPIRSGATAKPTSPCWRSTRTDLAAARLGDSDALEIGDFVLAIGSPFGLSQSVTRGIVSAKGRHNLDLGDGELKWQNFIQTDAAINPGNSGGPLVNLRGEVVGLNTAIASASGGNEGIGFSIPINIVARIARALVENNEVAARLLGRQARRSTSTSSGPRRWACSRLVGTRIIGDRAAIARRTGRPAGQRRDPRVQRRPRSNNDTHLISLVKLTEVGQRSAARRSSATASRSACTVEIGDCSEFPREQRA